MNRKFKEVIEAIKHLGSAHSQASHGRRGGGGGAAGGAGGGGVLPKENRDFAASLVEEEARAFRDDSEEPGDYEDDIAKGLSETASKIEKGQPLTKRQAQDAVNIVSEQQKFEDDDDLHKEMSAIISSLGG